MKPSELASPHIYYKEHRHVGITENKKKDAAELISTITRVVNQQVLGMM